MVAFIVHKFRNVQNQTSQRDEPMAFTSQLPS